MCEMCVAALFAGAYCANASVSASGVDCPAGQYCVAGLATPCPSGRYNAAGGSRNVSQCLLCPAGRYRANVGASSESMCLSCTAPESSDAGASRCWPGVLGMYCETGSPSHANLTMCSLLVTHALLLDRCLREGLRACGARAVSKYVNPCPLLVLQNDVADSPVCTRLTDDVLTIYFTQVTNSPDVSTMAALSRLVLFEPWLATSIQAAVCSSVCN